MSRVVRNGRIRQGGSLPAYVPFDFTKDGKAMYHEALRRKGLKVWTNESLTCACGKVALRVWHGVGYCKAHIPALKP